MSKLVNNTLFYGDNLPILHEYLPSESIDLIYLDPPFNSQRTYNVLFKDESGLDAEAQIAAFKDTWHWNYEAELTYTHLVTQGPERLGRVVGALRQMIGANQMMAYLVMMGARLVELHRVLKPTGSLYLHCDPTASHYLKILLDAIFSPEKFRSEVIWKRTSAHNSAKRYGPIHDVLFFYTKTDEYVWNEQPQPYDESYLKKFYRHVEENGRRYRLSDLTGAGKRNGETGQPWRGINPTEKNRHWMVPPAELDKLDDAGLIYWPAKGKVPAYKRYLDEMTGVPLQDVWNDINPLAAQAAERLGYPTQKPIALLERILLASSAPGDVILDPFCGCGTTIAAAQKHGRSWVGIDITHLSIALMKYRLNEMFPEEPFTVIGEPTTVGAARQLAQDNRYQFQWWALSLVKARPLGGDEGSKKGKKGADKGIDGVIHFIDDPTAQPKRLLVQVKSGKVGSKEIRDLVGTLEREKGAMALFITLEEPTQPMVVEAATAGFYHSPGWNQNYPKVQILTIEQLLEGARLNMPAQNQPGITFKQAGRAKQDNVTQANLFE